MKRLRTLKTNTRLPLAAGAVMLWVAVGPWIWGFAGSRAAVANHVFLVFAFGPLALLIVALRPAAIVTLAGGAWLVLSPWVLGYATSHAAWVNELISGLLLTAVCLKATGADRLAFVRRDRKARTPSRPPAAVERVPSSS
jgi:SPW repeat